MPRHNSGLAGRGTQTPPTPVPQETPREEAGKRRREPRRHGNWIASMQQRIVRYGIGNAFRYMCCQLCGHPVPGLLIITALGVALGVLWNSVASFVLAFAVIMIGEVARVSEERFGFETNPLTAYVAGFVIFLIPVLF